MSGSSARRDGSLLASKQGRSPRAAAPAALTMGAVPNPFVTTRPRTEELEQRLEQHRAELTAY